MTYSATQWRDLLRPGLRERTGDWAPHRDSDIRVRDEVRGSINGEPYHYAAKLYLTSYDRRTELNATLDVDELNAHLEGSRFGSGVSALFFPACRKILPAEPDNIVSYCADQIVALNNADPRSPTKEQIEAILAPVLAGLRKA